jgi:putative transposase
MSFQTDHFYHIYNRGNNKQKIFFGNANYSFFLKKVEIEIAPTCDILAYCLMPNHYHFLIYFGNSHANFRENIKMENIERKMGTLQSSYTRAVNHQEGRVGSLFQAKFKVVEIVDFSQAINCFKYIHRNPVKAGLVSEPGLWAHSSFNEYYLRHGGMCNIKIAYEMLGVPRDAFELIKWTSYSEKDNANSDFL